MTNQLIVTPTVRLPVTPVTPTPADDDDHRAISNPLQPDGAQCNYTHQSVDNDDGQQYVFISQHVLFSSNLHSRIRSLILGPSSVPALIQLESTRCYNVLIVSFQVADASITSTSQNINLVPCKGHRAVHSTSRRLSRKLRLHYGSSRKVAPLGAETTKGMIPVHWLSCL